MLFQKITYNCPNCQQKRWVVHEAFVGWTCAYCNKIEPLVVAFKPLLDELTSDKTTGYDKVVCLFKQARVARRHVSIAELANFAVRYYSVVKRKFTDKQLVEIVTQFTLGKVHVAKTIVSFFQKSCEAGLEHHRETHAVFLENKDVLHVSDQWGVSPETNPEEFDDAESVSSEAMRDFLLDIFPEGGEMSWNDGFQPELFDSSVNGDCHVVSSKEDSHIVGSIPSKYLVECKAGNKSRIVNPVTHCPACGSERRVLDRCHEGGKFRKNRFLVISFDLLRKTDVSVCDCKGRDRRRVYGSQDNPWGYTSRQTTEQHRKRGPRGNRKVGPVVRDSRLGTRDE